MQCWGSYQSLLLCSLTPCRVPLAWKGAALGSAPTEPRRHMLGFLVLEEADNSAASSATAPIPTQAFPWSSNLFHSIPTFSAHAHTHTHPEESHCQQEHIAPVTPSTPLPGTEAECQLALASLPAAKCLMALTRWQLPGLDVC